MTLTGGVHAIPPAERHATFKPSPISSAINCASGSAILLVCPYRNASHRRSCHRPGRYHSCEDDQNDKKGKTMKRTLLACLTGSVVAMASIATACGVTMPSGPSSSPSPAASGSRSSAPTTVSSNSSSYAPSGAPAGTRNVTINDPILNMTAYSLTIPGNWMFQGAVFQGSPCVPGAFAVIRTQSPDGLTGMKLLPRLDWAWLDTQRGPQA